MSCQICHHECFFSCFAYLSALAVDCEWMADSRLNHKAIQCRAEDAVVVQAVHEHDVTVRLRCGHTIHHSLMGTENTKYVGSLSESKNG